MDNINLGVQLYTVRKYLKNAPAFDEILAYIKTLNVSDVQISAMGNISIQDQKKILDKYGMKVCVTHSSFDRMLNDLDNLIEEHKLINCDCIGLGSLPKQYRGSADGVREFIKLMTPVFEKIRAAGMHFAYHNHAFEYEKFDDGKCIMDILLEETNPDNFWFIPDVCWFHVAGKDPVKELERMKGRVKVVHFKDYAMRFGKVRFKTLGKGVVDLDACYKACQRLNMNYIMYEQDLYWERFSPKYATKMSCKKMFEIKAANN